MCASHPERRTKESCPITEPSPQQGGTNDCGTTLTPHRLRAGDSVAQRCAEFGAIVSEIEHRFRHSGAVHLSFFIVDAGSRVKVTLSRSAARASHVEQLIERDTTFYNLTFREHEVASAVALGFSNDEIAGICSLSKRTVDRHVSNILTRLGLHNRAQLATLITSVDGWVVPIPPNSVLEHRVPVLGLLTGAPHQTPFDSGAIEVVAPSLHIGSILPDDPEKQMEAIAMSRGEDLAVTGTSADSMLCARFPVRITRIFSSADGIDGALSQLANAGIHALVMGNFDIATGRRVLENQQLRCTPVLHSMVNRSVHSYTDPGQGYSHVFQMCADESVYIRAFAAYVQKYAPTAQRISIIARVSDSVEVIDTMQETLADPETEIQVIRLDDEMENLAEIALELLQFDPAVVYLGIYVESVLTLLISHMRSLGIDAKIFSVWVPGLPGFAQRHPKLSEGLIWSTLVGNSNNHFGSLFRSAFESKYRASPGIGSAAVHYDMIGLLRRAWQDAGLETASGPLTEALNAVRFTGVTGSFHFDHGRRRRALCYPFDTDDPAIGQPCLTFEIRQGKSIPILLRS